MTLITTTGVVYKLVTKKLRGEGLTTPTVMVSSDIANIVNLLFPTQPVQPARKFGGLA